MVEEQKSDSDEYSIDSDLIANYLTGPKQRAVKFRYTFPKGTTLSEESMPFINQMCRAFVDMFQYPYGSMGIEDLDKFGEKTHLHIHIHCITYKSIDALRKAFKKLVKDYDEKREGNELYSLKECKDILHMKRFLRYPFKQSRRGLGYVEAFPNVFTSDFDLETQIECACEEWERLVEINRLKREKSLNPNTFEKFEIYMEDKTYNNLADIAGHIDEFYLVEKMSMNLSTMGGYIRTFARSKNIITKEQQVNKLLEFV